MFSQKLDWSSAVKELNPILPSTPVWFYIPNIIGYFRIVLMILSTFYAIDDWHRYLMLYSVSYLLDAVDGYTARLFNQTSKMGAILDMIADRATTTTLLMILTRLYPMEWIPLWTNLVALDIMAHFAQMNASIQSGSDSHKKVLDRHWLLQFYYQRKILFVVVAGTEAFYLSLYLLHFGIDFGGLLKPLLLYVFTPICIFKQITNFMQLFGSLYILVQLQVPTKGQEPKRKRSSRSSRSSSSTKYSSLRTKAR